MAVVADPEKVLSTSVKMAAGGAQVSLGYKPGGKPHRKLLYGKTRAEVSEAMKRILRDQQLGLTITSERQTLKQFLTEWLANTVKPQNKQRTYRSYDWIIRISADDPQPGASESFAHIRSRAAL